MCKLNNLSDIKVGDTVVIISPGGVRMTKPVEAVRDGAILAGGLRFSQLDGQEIDARMTLPWRLQVTP